nr:MAG TPA: hypothetical protein [Caudoviricetes sp.]
MRPFEKIFKNNFFRVLQNFGGHGLIQLFKRTGNLITHQPMGL